MSATVTADTGESSPPRWGEIIPPAARIRLAVVAALLLVVYWRSIEAHLVQRWINDGNWSHGWLIPVFSVYLLASRREELAACRPRPNYLGAVVVLLSLAMYFIAAWRLRMSYPQALSLVGAIFGVTLLLGGWRVMRIAWFPILFLVLAVPLPDRLYVALTMPLRQWASTAAAALMPLFISGLHTDAQAVVIDYVMPGKPPGTLNVEEACSGMRLMMAFLTLGVAMAYLGDRPLWQRVIMVLSCVPIALFCNTLRVTVTGLFIVLDLGNLATGTPHQLLGIIMLLVALSLFALVGYVLRHLFVEVPVKEPA